jgi:hypothetical protein
MKQTKEDRLLAEAYNRLIENSEFSKMSHHEFDQTNNGWRKFGSNHKAAIQAILDFVREKGWGTNKDHVLRWHLFQLYAMENMNTQAKALLQNIIKSGDRNDYYSRGTLAWMNGNKKALQMEIDAAKADKEYMNCCAINIKILERMLNGIGKKYSEVY